VLLIFLPLLQVGLSIDDRRCWKEWAARLLALGIRASTDEAQRYHRRGALLPSARCGADAARC
jgi:hypothetical protein